MPAPLTPAPARTASRRHLHGRLLEVSGKDRLRLLHRVDLEQPLTQLGRARHSLRVPAEMLAELERRAAGVALQPQRQPRVLQRHGRSEEHTSELQSPCNLVCRLLLEKKKKNQ